MFSRDDKIPGAKLAAVQYVVLGICLVLGYGLWRLQVVGGSRYELLAEQNRVRTVPILAPRGKILDREGRDIVGNYPSVSALLLRDQVKEIEPHIEQIALVEHDEIGAGDLVLEHLLDRIVMVERHVGCPLCRKCRKIGGDPQGDIGDIEK